MLIFFIVVVILGGIFLKIERKKQDKHFDKVIENIMTNINTSQQKTYKEIIEMKEQYVNIAKMLGDGKRDE